MMRTLVAAVAVLSQVLAVLPSGFLVMCVHDDGHAVIELASDLCCKADHEGNGSCTASGGKGHSDSAVGKGDDRCWDSPLSLYQVQVSPRAMRTAPSDQVTSFSLPAFLSGALPGGVAGASGPSHECGPPWSSSLEHIRTVVLRC